MDQLYKAIIEDMTEKMQALLALPQLNDGENADALRDKACKEARTSMVTALSALGVAGYYKTAKA